MIFQLGASRAKDGDTVASYLSYDCQMGLGLRHTVYTGDEHGPTEGTIRLIRLDTPERGEPGYAEAKSDVSLWLDGYAGQLEVEYHQTDSFGRLVGDVYVVGDRGNTLTQHMLLLGWEPWLG